METKRKRTTNRAQFEAIVEKMKKNPDIAKNMTKKSPDLVLEFWTCLMTELNALGPPSKSVHEWKKVWSDYKAAIRKKLAHNKREQMATGGGRNNQMFLSTMEEEVSELTCLDTYVHGTKNVLSFGAQMRPFNVEELPPTSTSTGYAVVDEEEGGIENIEPITGDDTPIVSKARPRRMAKQINLLEKQISIQEMHLKKISKSVEGNNSNFKKIYRGLDKLHDDFKTTNELLGSFVEETKKHNSYMQKLELEKNELKKKFLELKLRRLYLADM